jgi:hypothetical protein
LLADADRDGRYELCLPSRGGMVLTATNAERSSVGVTCRGLDRFGSCRLPFETRRPVFARDSLSPSGVHVYRFLDQRTQTPVERHV